VSRWVISVWAKQGRRAAVAVGLALALWWVGDPFTVGAGITVTG
jgi:hypothetical protein